VVEKIQIKAQKVQYVCLRFDKDGDLTQDNKNGLQRQTRYSQVLINDSIPLNQAPATTGCDTIGFFGWSGRTAPPFQAEDQTMAYR